MRSLRVSIFIVLAVVLSSLQVAASGELPVKRIDCRIEQLTALQSADAGSPSLSGDGRRLAFISNGDFTGGNPERNFEIFLMDVRRRTFTQVTHTTTNDNLKPVLSPDGRRLALITREELVPGGNPDGNRELFIYHLPTGTAVQVSDTVGEDIVYRSDPSFDEHGDRLVFSVMGDFGPDVGPFGIEEVVLRDVDGGLLLITRAPGKSSTHPSLSGDGRWIVFDSNADFTDQNGDGNFEIFLYDLVEDEFRQLTNTQVYFQHSPKICGAGHRVTFQSRQAHMPEAVPDAANLYLYDLLSEELSHVTTAAAGNPLLPVINHAGDRVAFYSPADPTGQNLEGNDEIFLYDVRTRQTLQVTDVPTGGSRNPAIDASGQLIVFQSTANLVPEVGNVQGRVNLFLATCPQGLVVNRGRFEVTAGWRDAAGNTGFAIAEPMTDETGYFWFFSPNNVEVVIKVLNGCDINDHFWVFAAGLTNVEVTMSVVDTWTGTERIYRNPLGVPFAPIQDDTAFATCDASQP